MKFSQSQVDQYLAIVNDQNPLHNTIVPGQLVVDYLMNEYEIEWHSYKVKYLQTIVINEVVEVCVKSENEIVVSSEENGVKLVIIMN
ncbi:hypothetical protein E2558_10380 [Staphylococcus pragensis]|uniref:Uncharacterized protein n=1 Tax=Staphylococcus pragensis TaxID=1611836 RepID=A0A4Z1B870_9STAP|nr:MULTISPECIES: hypothetical protein [Staphylococcus]RTX91269.1 hypothetical protein CD154_02500 [Staphylococcus carnosus]TGN24464.1 hypothetical protein E2558_10380 [Staphylococcus pragensis]GGG98783.1 hypothetical protein GCM10007342_23310 [Staphylococcus pragensis]